MKPGRLNLTIQKGATLRRRFVWSVPQSGGGRLPKNLAGADALAIFKINGTQALRCRTSDGTITTNANGVIELHLAAPVVNRAPAGSGAWGLAVQPSGEDRVILLAGQVTIVEAVA